MILPLGLFLGTTVSLFRGAELPSGNHYWAVADTFLDPKAPTENFGRDMLLSGGGGQMILIRFGDLNHVAASISEASLVLHQEIGNAPKLKAVYRIDKRWGEGPGRRGDINFMGGADNGRVNPPGGATFKDRFAGSVPWDGKGATGPREAIPVTGVTMDSKDGICTISGLGAVLQEQLKHPDGNFGLALEFDAPCDFDSSDAPSITVRPRLDIMALDTEVASYDAAVKSVTRNGNRLAATVWSERGTSPKTKLKWFLDDQQIADTDVPELKEGQTKVLELVSGTLPGDPRAHTVRAELDAADGSWTNNSVTYWLNGTPLSVSTKDPDGAQEAVRSLNEVLLPQSRFSFAMDGAMPRFNLVFSESAPTVTGTGKEMLRGLLKAAGLKSADGLASLKRPDTGSPILQSIPNPGPLGLGDTSDESGLLRGLGRVYEPWSDPILDEAVVFPTDLLSAYEVAQLNNVGATPTNYYLRLTTQAAQVLQKATGSLQTLDGKELFKGPVSEQGLFVVPSTAFSGQGAYWVVAEQGKGKGGALVWDWQLKEGAARSGKRPVMIQYALPVADIDLDESTNLVRGKPVTSSVTSSDLYELTDGATDKGLSLAKAGDWAEIDLGRDRLFGAVDLSFVGQVPTGQLDIYVRETAEEQEERRIFARTKDIKWAVNALAKDSTLRLFGVPSQARYIRIVWRGKEPISLSEVRLIGGKK